MTSSHLGVCYLYLTAALLYLQHVSNLESGTRSLEPGVWNPESGTRSLEPESGTWSLEPGVWNRSLEAGVWNLELGT